jgi:hypothetical protein
MAYFVSGKGKQSSAAKMGRARRCGSLNANNKLSEEDDPESGW